MSTFQLNIDLQSLKNVELVAPEKYAAVEAFLNRPLHYLKTSALSPTDLSLSVISDRINVEQTVEIEVLFETFSHDTFML